MASYAVVACPKCRKARVVEPGRAQAQCAHCGHVVKLADAVMTLFGSLEEAQAAVGASNAKAARRTEEFVQAHVPPAPAPERHESAADRAAARARGAGPEARRIEAVARALSEEGRAFTEEEFLTACEGAGIAPARSAAHLTRLVELRVVTQPRAGAYRWV